MEAQDRDIGPYLDNYAEVPFEVLAGFKDVQSGKDSDRPELTAALDLCRRTGAELLVAKLDRLSRRVSFIAAQMDDPKVGVRVASMPNADKSQLHVCAALAERERDFISLRTKAALTEAKAKGPRLGRLRDKTGARNEAIQRDARAHREAVAGLGADAGRDRRGSRRGRDRDAEGRKVDGNAGEAVLDRLEA